MNTIVSFETAKLLKEKGFNNVTLSGYNKVTNKPINMYNINSQNILISAPTIAEVVMWCFNIHKIWIVSFPELFNGQIVRFYSCIFEDGIGEDDGDGFFNSPIEAYEQAIKYVLTNLI